MKEEINTPSCGREGDLIAFVYDELNPSAATVFRRHMKECSSCSSELPAFVNIHESMIDWRNESLVGVSTPPVQSWAEGRSDRTKPTALTALREFLNLSPLWMKGAMVLASLLFCLFAVLAAARFRDSSPAPLAIAPNVKSYSDQELNALVDRRVQQELQRIKNPSESTPTPSVVASGGFNRVIRGSATNRSRALASASPQPKARRPLSKDERQQLAADLRLIDDPTDRQLDLLDDRINQ